MSRDIATYLWIAGRQMRRIRRLRELSPLYDMHKEGIDLTKIEWAHH